MHVYPYDFLIVLITCACLLLRLLTIYGFRLSTQVEIFFLSPHLKGRPPLRPCHRWSDDLHAEDPTLESLYRFFLPFSLLLILCILSSLKASLVESHKTSVLTKNAGKPLHFFKWVFSGTGDSTATLLISHWISSDTFSIDRGVGYSHGKSRHQHKLKTHGSRRQEMRVTSHYGIK